MGSGHGREQAYRNLEEQGHHGQAPVDEQVGASPVPVPRQEQAVHLGRERAVQRPVRERDRPRDNHTLGKAVGQIDVSVT